MIILTFLVLCLILGGAAYWMYRALGATKGALLAAQRKAVHCETRLTETRRATRAAEKRCMQALVNLHTAIAHANQAMDVAAQIETVGAQVQAIFDCVGGEYPALGADQSGIPTFAPYVADPPALTAVSAGFQTTYQGALAS